MDKASSTDELASASFAKVMGDMFCNICRALSTSSLAPRASTPRAVPPRSKGSADEIDAEVVQSGCAVCDNALGVNEADAGLDVSWLRV